MILNIENYTIKIDHEARTVEVSQKTLNVETETLMEAVERVSQPTLEDYEEMSQHFDQAPRRNHDSHPEPSQAEINAQRLDDFEEYWGRKATLQEAKNLFKLGINPFGWLHQAPTTRKPRALETQPRAPCRSTCCGTLNRRTRDGSCAGCRDLTPVERATLFLTNNDILEMVE